PLSQSTEPYPNPDQCSPNPVSEGTAMPVQIKFPKNPSNLKEYNRPSLKRRVAYAWLKRGAPLVALRERGKVPIEKGWRERPLKKKAEIDKLFRERPDANIGYLTGGDGQFICIDVDGPEGKE